MAELKDLILRWWGTWFVLLRAALRRPWPRMPIDDLPSGYGEVVGLDAFRPHIAEDWPALPLWLIAVDLISGQRRVLRGGVDADPALTLADAVLASSAVPGVASPICAGEQSLCDGGVHSSTNLDLALSGPDGPIICIAPICYDPERPPALIWRLARALFQRQLMPELAQVRRAGRLLLLIAPSPDEVRGMGANFLSTRRMRSVYEASYIRAQKVLADPAYRSPLVALGAGLQALR